MLLSGVLAFKLDVGQIIEPSGSAFMYCPWFVDFIRNYMYMYGLEMLQWSGCTLCAYFDPSVHFLYSSW